jgi:hypothetical protein
MLLVVAALCDMARIAPDGRDTVQKVKSAMERRGVSLDEGTIKRILGDTGEAVEHRQR